MLIESPRGTDLQIRAWAGSSFCSDIREPEVRETADLVDIRVPVYNRGNSDCTSDIFSDDFTVSLSEPLGKRSLQGCWPDDPAALSPDTTLVPDCQTILGG